MKIRFVFAFFSAAATCALFFASACSNQGEGDRCDKLAGDQGNADCQSGLVCQFISDNDGDRCCPADPGQATSSVCRRPSSGGADVAPPPDSAVEETGTDAADANETGDARDDANDGESQDAPSDG